MVVKVQIFVVFLLAVLSSCGDNQMLLQAKQIEDYVDSIYQDSLLYAQPIEVGAAQIEQYLPLLENKKVALLVNQTSRVGEVHLVDSLLGLGVQIQKIFAPEHGFRGEADAGAKIKDGRDPKSGLPIISLYGKKKAPSKTDLANIDLIIFDVQDVGARFYTYISTLHYLMQAALDNDLPLMVLDRPNPNGHYVDGPVLDSNYRSFVGIHEVAMVHGMTVGEYAQMVVGESWIEGDSLALTVIPWCQLSA